LITTTYCFHSWKLKNDEEREKSDDQQAEK
jgi:hypothetical protein